ncbi:hypothetical protein ACSQ67_009418 [Phaseolus vulgaris]
MPIWPSYLRVDAGTNNCGFVVCSTTTDSSKIVMCIWTVEALKLLSFSIWVLGYCDVDVAHLAKGISRFKALTGSTIETHCNSLIREAKIGVEDLNDVIVVGDCSSIPRVKSLVANICREKFFDEGINPLEAAVRGAALAGAVASDVKDFVLMGNLGDLNLLTIQITPLAIELELDLGNYLKKLKPNFKS